MLKNNRLQSERAPRASQEDYKELAESITDVFFAMSKDLKYTYWNKACEYLTGFSAENVVGKSLTEVFPDVRGTKIEQFYLDALKTKRSKCFVTAYRIRDKDYVFEISAYPTKIGLSVFAKDITERKRAEEELIRLSSAVRMSTDSIVISDLDGKIIDMNEAALKMCGGTNKNDLIGSSSLRLIAPEEREKASARMKEVLEKGYIKNQEFHATSKEGNRVLVETSVSIINGADGKPIGFAAISRDITERKKAEEALRESEQRFRGLSEASLEAVAIVDKGRILNVNQTFVEMFQYELSEIIGKNAVDFVTPECRDIVLKNILSGYEERYEAVALRKDGSTFVEEICGKAMPYDGRMVRVAALRDITEQKKAEERIRNIIDTSPDAIVWVNTTGKITLVNKKGLEITGFSENDLIGRNIMDAEALTQESKEKIMKSFMNRLKGVDSLPYEVEIVTKKGEIIPAELSASAIFEGGKPVGVQSILRDIRERKAMDEKLRQYSEHLEELVLKRSTELLESEERYSILVEGGSDGVVTLQDGKIVFVNKRGQQIVGYSKNELIGLPFAKLVGEKHRQFVEKKYGRRLKGGPVQSTYEIELITKNGEYVPVEVSTGLTSHEGRPADAIIVRDIRDRKQLEEQRVRFERFAAIGELAAMVGHDLRNPLQSIKNATSCLKAELNSNLNSEAQELMKIIDDSIEYSNKIVKDLLYYSGEMHLERVRTAPKLILKRALSLIELPQNVQVFDCVNDEPEISVDEAKIVRVFVNIILNAIEAMPDGGKLAITSTESNGSLEVAFADTGTGMPNEVLKELWTPLHTKRAKGIGLGLPICKRIVEAHLGSIWVESTVGKGTTFTVTLPMKPEIEYDEEISVNSAASTREEVETQHSAVRIL